MANEEQVKILKSGVDAWNKWRRDNPKIRINLANANLNSIDISQANLFQAELCGANLNGTNLYRADLCGAILEKCNLNGAELNESNLKRSWLRWAKLTGACLVEADLSYANLSGADLREATFREARLRKTNLNGADLRGAKLSGADLRGADLRETKLSREDLRDTDLSEAFLTEIYFGEVLLSGSNLQGAVLDGADIGTAVIGNTVFANIDLSKIHGLSKVKHEKASRITTDTLIRSKEKIAEVFLRGCGLMDWEVESAKLYREGLSEKDVDDILYRVHDLQVHQTIQYYSVFISYCSKDHAFARMLYDDLQKNGVRCWFAPKDIKGGQKIHEQIDSAIQVQERLLLVLSESSMTSEWVMTEIAKARRKELKENRQVLFPIRLVDFKKLQEWECFDADRGKDSAREIREYFIPDFSHWDDEKSYRPVFERLLKDLRAKEAVHGE